MEMTFLPVLAALTMDTVWICIGAGVVIGLIAVLVMKSQLRSVHARNEAGEYMKRDSFQLTACHEIFLYRTITRVERPQDNPKR